MAVPRFHSRLQIRATGLPFSRTSRIFTPESDTALRDQRISETIVRRTLAVVPIHSEVNRLPIPPEDLQSIARILAAGYLRCRDRLRRDFRLDSPAKSSPDGRVVNDSEKGDKIGNRD